MIKYILGAALAAALLVCAYVFRIITLGGHL